MEMKESHEELLVAAKEKESLKEENLELRTDMGALHEQVSNVLNSQFYSILNE